jgi:sugar phosphate isomerase/epimerase
MVDRTADLGVELLQICDHPAVTELSDGDLAQLRRHADRRGVALELGTRGVTAAVLDRWLALARRLEVTLVRSMLFTPDSRPKPEQARTWLAAAMPAWEAAGVTLALETYEQVPTSTLVDVVAAVGSSNLGICSDPANCVASLEHPLTVAELVAPHLKNMHVKDFRFSRQAGWVGFTLVGAPLGEGLLDFPAVLTRLQPAPGVNQVVEHWLPWQGDPATTVALEQQWTEHAVTTLRSHQS